ncbi:MAG: bifunctional (p)ppGpp synthetase/guanosine-3',5'-bis(diphosphate) 3'-pyrophosphohydrolase [Spirochaetaceae bacterium]|nr:MAG: bifunctional (p)ppGpp synthetase/guanosine-3',5'-bis(diphosphate) 3'-pyrophosphohydrolase [Spirochaetaceae bacterium]
MEEPRPLLLERALAVALRAHKGQTDRAGLPYITHPLRMMARTSDPDEQVVAVLHDVVEDGLENGVTMATLVEEGFPERIIAAVDALTRRLRSIRPDRDADEAYDDFVERSAANPLARRVKLLDLRDNMDLSRLPEVHAADFERLGRYVRAWHRLSDCTIL